MGDAWFPQHGSCSQRRMPGWALRLGTGRLCLGHLTPVSATTAMPPGMFTSKSSAYASWAARWKANQAELAGKNAEPARPEAGTVRQRPPLLERMREALPEDQRAKVDVATTKAAAMARTLKLEGDYAG
jgi:hypothetical protein